MIQNKHKFVRVLHTNCANWVAQMTQNAQRIFQDGT